MSRIYCAYYVSYSPPGCDLQPGDIVYMDCDSCFCSDIVISDGPCAGAYLVTFDGSCF